MVFFVLVGSMGYCILVFVLVLWVCIFCLCFELCLDLVLVFG